MSGTRWVASWLGHEVPRGTAHRVTVDGEPTGRYRAAVCDSMVMDYAVDLLPEPRTWCVTCKGTAGVPGSNVAIKR